MATTQGNGTEDAFVPFTTGERIGQLGEIDEVCATPAYPICLRELTLHHRAS
jgi:hypothetical protein